MLDGSKDSTGLPPSVQYKSLCRTTHHQACRSYESNDWQTNRLIPRPGHILLHWVFPRLRLRIEDRSLPCLFLFDPCLFLCFGESPCLHLYRAGKGENHPCGSHHCLFDKPFLPLFPLDHQNQVFFLPPFRILRLFISKECSLGPFGSSVAIPFSLSFTSSGGP